MQALVILIVLGFLGWLLWDLQEKVEQQNPAAAMASGTSSYSAALTRASEENKPVLLIFTSARCGPCQHMKNKVYPSASVQAVASRLVWLTVDVNDSRNHPLAREYGVRGLPTLVIVDSQGKVKSRLSGARSPQDLAAWLRQNS